MIYTFYSQKYDIDHDLAILNIADLFYRAGLRVLLIDWDLETPGLERYFSSLDIQQILDQPGLIDMLLQYKEDMTRKSVGKNAPFELENPSKYLISVYDEGSALGKIYLLTAGRRSSPYLAHYNQSVLSFNWQEFYEVWGGELYFDWLRKQFEKIVDIVLISSRNGFTKMGSVCTYHLADVIVMLCEPNQQMIQATYSMAQKFTALPVQQIRDERPLKVTVVPFGINEGVDKKLLTELEQELLNKFNEINFTNASGLITSGRDTWALRIPQVPYYTFSETIVTQQPPAERNAALYEAYLRLTKYLGQQAPENSKIQNLTELNSLPSPTIVIRKDEQPSISNHINQFVRKLAPRDQVKICRTVNLRQTPGYVNKPASDIIGDVAQGMHGILLNGPYIIDDLSWWRIGIIDGTGNVFPPRQNKQFTQLKTRVGIPRRSLASAVSLEIPQMHKSMSFVLPALVSGWVVEKTPNGEHLLQKLDVRDEVLQSSLLLEEPSYFHFETSGYEFNLDNVDSLILVKGEQNKEQVPLERIYRK